MKTALNRLIPLMAALSVPLHAAVEIIPAIAPSGVDDALNLQVLLPHPAVGWGLLPRGYWPFLWSPSHKGWFWVAPGGRWVWDYKLQRWHAS